MVVKYRKKRAVKSNTTIRKVAREEAKKVINQVVETKYVYNFSSPGGAVHDYIDVGASVATGALQQGLCIGLIHGTGENQVIGDKIKPVYVKIRFNLANYASTDTHNMLRLIVVQGKGGSQPTIDDILHSTGNKMTPLSPYDEDFRGQYTLLHDKVHAINGFSTYPASDSCQRNGTIYIKGSKLRQVSFANATMLPSANDIFFYAVSDSTTTYHPKIVYWATLAYRDA